MKKLRMPVKKNKRVRIHNVTGSALITAIVSMTLLVLLGIAVATLSMGTLINNAADKNTNDSYYAAEAGINSAIEHLKFETSKYYSDMMKAPTPAVYNTMYNAFFTNIQENTQLYFIEPKIKDITTNTTFSIGSYDTAQDIAQYNISCRATAADGTQYIVNGSIGIKRIDVAHTQYIWITDDAAIKAGNSLDLESKNSVTVTGGNVLVGDLLYIEKVEGQVPYSITGGNLIIDPTLGSNIVDFLVYPSYTDPVLPAVDFLITESSYTINWDMPSPSTLTTAVGTDLHFTACTIPEGTIYGKGDVHISNCVVNGDVYSDGDVFINNYTSINGNIYCRGNVYITNVEIGGNIFCDGLVDFNNGNLDASIYAAAGITVHDGISSGNMFSPGEISIENATVSDGIIYSSSKLTVGAGDMTAVLFSGGDIEFTSDVSIAGTVIAKNDIYFKVDANKDLYVDYYYSETTVDNIVNDPDNSFFFSRPEEPRLDENVFFNETVTALGRV